jgi:sporulation protein YlmC with PRC-barrel domain
LLISDHPFAVMSVFRGGITMKRIAFLIGTLLLVLSFVGVQAFAGEMKSNMKENQSLQTSGAASSKAFYKGNDILGKEAVTANGENLGSVEDVAISQDGRIAYVILARGEILGVGGKLVPIPWNMVSFRMPAEQREPGQRADKTSEDAKLVINVAKQDLDQAPTLNSDEWHRLTDSNFDRQVHSYFDQHRGGASGAMKDAGKHPAKGTE